MRVPTVSLGISPIDPRGYQGISSPIPGDLNSQMVDHSRAKPLAASNRSSCTLRA